MSGISGAAISGFSHLYVEVTDLDRSEKFYHEIIGLDLLGRGLVNEEGRNSTLALNTRHRVILVEVDEVEPFRPNSSSIHHAWYLTADQFDRAQARMKASGYEVGDNRAQFRAVGERSMDIFDPDGHRYQIQSFGAEASDYIIENVGEIACGVASDYAVGDVRQFGRGKFFVVRLEDGFIAYSRWCTHKNGLLTWQPEHWRFYCPMHGVTYNRKGENTSFCHDVSALRMHPLVLSDDGVITVRPDEVIERDGFDPAHITAAELVAARAAG